MNSSDWSLPGTTRPLLTPLLLLSVCSSSLFCCIIGHRSWRLNLDIVDWAGTLYKLAIFARYCRLHLLNLRFVRVGVGTLSDLATFRLILLVICHSPCSNRLKLYHIQMHVQDEPLSFTPK